MNLFSIRSAIAAAAMMTAGGSAYATTFQGNYDVNFKVAGGGSVAYCVNLTSQGAEGPYRDSGTATFYLSGSNVGAGSYVVYRNVITVAITRSGQTEYLTATGKFAKGAAFDTATTDFTNSALIIGTATFSETKQHAACNPGTVSQ